MTEILTIICNLLLPSVRVIAIISSSPLYGEIFIDRKIKIIFSFFIMFISLLFVSKEEEIVNYSINYVNILEQYLIGTLIGFSFKLIFTVANIAGEIVSLQIGLSFSTLFDIHNNGNISVVSRLFNNLMLLIFLSLNGHLWIITIIIESFNRIPTNQHINVSVFFILVNFLGILFLKGMILSLPIITIILIMNILLALLNRIIPQLTIFSIIFPITLFIGMFLLYYLLNNNIIFLKSVIIEYFDLILKCLYNKIFKNKYLV